ncbi:MAG TPA: hypothetical protein DCW96_02950 [Stenotrophomonas sp.]|nr:hypothetical protein [Stenotrophomonas sp.]
MREWSRGEPEHPISDLAYDGPSICKPVRCGGRRPGDGAPAGGEVSSAPLPQGDDAMSLQDGELTSRIRFERKVTERDPLGGDVASRWETVASVWAKTTNNLAATTELIAAGADRYREQVRFDLRLRTVEPAWRIVFRGKVFDIKSIAPSNDRSELAIIAVAGMSDG